MKDNNSSNNNGPTEDKSSFSLPRKSFNRLLSSNNSNMGKSGKTKCSRCFDMAFFDLVRATLVESCYNCNGSYGYCHGQRAHTVKVCQQKFKKPFVKRHDICISLYICVCVSFFYLFVFTFCNNDTQYCLFVAFVLFMTVFILFFKLDTNVVVCEPTHICMYVRTCVCTLSTYVLHCCTFKQNFQIQ